MDIKKKIYQRIKYAFDEAHDDDEEWINNNLHLQIKDNCPVTQTNRYGQRQKAKCEFCGRRHDARDDICEVKSSQCENGNDFENGVNVLTLGDLYKQLESDRSIKLECMINIESKA